MSKYHELTGSPAVNKKRVGRGISSGQGKTAGRGTKGQGARTGKKLNATFMGGQGALVRRIPKKRGFTSKRPSAQVIYLDQLEQFKATTVTNQTLFQAGLIKNPRLPAKLIVRGALSAKVTVQLQAASASAIAALQAAGGSFTATAVRLVETQPPAKTSNKSSASTQVK